MDQKDIALINDFIDGLCAGKHSSGAFTNVADSSELEILKKKDLMWKICTTLIVFRDAGMLKLLSDTLGLITSVGGGQKFSHLFIAELFSTNIGLSHVPRSADLKFEKKLIRPFDTDDIRDNLTKFKIELQKIIDSNGGITLLAKKTGLSQPSLSRMMNSGAMPRRQTLIKIFEALNIKSLEI